jgi:hypothetical protein
VSGPDREDLLTIARAEHLSVDKLELLLAGHRCGVSLEKAGRIRSRAEELRAKLPASRRVRRASGEEART